MTTDTREPDLLDMRVTITLIVVAVTLSLLDFGGRDFAALKMDSDLGARPWTPFTSCLLHGDSLHLLFNVYWLHSLGRRVEWSMGSLRMAWLVLLVSGSPMLAQWFFSGSAIGLSGIVYGLAGFLWALSRWDPRRRDLFSPELARFFVVWFFVCILFTRLGIFPVANVAHGMGAVVGVAAGWALAATAPGPGVRYPVLAAIVLLPLLGLGVYRGPLLSGDWASLYDAGTKALQDQRHEEARELLERAVSVNPEIASAWHNLGVARLRSGDRIGALEALTTANEINPQDSFTREVLRKVESGELSPPVFPEER